MVSHNTVLSIAHIHLNQCHIVYFPAEIMVPTPLEESNLRTFQGLFKEFLDIFKDLLSQKNLAFIYTENRI